MAAKEEAAVLKYLKKNPSQEALDISFAIDIDEDLVKQALAALEGKGQVESKDVGGRAQWSLAAPKPKAAPAPAPKAEAAPVAAEGGAVAAEAAPVKASKAEVVAEEGDEECCCAKGGVSKCFVVSVSAVVLVLAIVIGYVLGGMQVSSAAKALADSEIKAVRDSVGLVKVSLNQRLDNLESQIRDLKAAPKAEPAKEETKKAPAKPAKKKRK